MNEQQERLIELLDNAQCEWLNEHTTKKSLAEYVADRLLAEGVIVPPKKTSQEELWEKNAEQLRCGGFGSIYGEECYGTMLRYWQAQEQAGYPHASENVKCFEIMIAERNK